ncbi:hypothetical protein KIN20_037380 [Parelaphostrongylus tenuis]|uniref:Uncharacterized protein n=1 Tax=Parelaphostrongylus tenuis TaxID=148309 RepID=A0AAD5WME9_PARTN|nr:hypothetical protein KIN20_037380 [Parelaphostrongylus tenuis]
MDLLDDITSLMTKIDKERPVVKGKKTTKEKQQEAPAATLATPLSGFRILKKVATSSHPTSSPEGGSSFTAERSSSMTGGSTKRLQEFEVDSKGGSFT